MEWSDDGLILGARRHGEAGVILEAMTRAHGRHFGLVRGGRSSRLRALLQPGNTVFLVWRARLESHLGNYSVDADRLRAAALMASPLALAGLQTLAGHLRLLPERDPHQSLFSAACVVLDHLEEPETAARLMLRLELALLEELGFGLDLSRCALTGAREGLAFVSPRTGKAASAAAAAQWKDRLLPFPFILGGSASDAPLRRQLAEAFALTGHFLGAHVWEPRGIAVPEQRARFSTLIDNALAQG